MRGGSEFSEFLKEALAPLGHIVVRPMFGGAGIYCDGTFFAILLDDSLYLKAGEAERPFFVREGMGPFTYSTKSGTAALVSYYRAPERLLDETDELVVWARRAVEAARRSASSPAVKSSSRRMRRPASPRE